MYKIPRFEEFIQEKAKTSTVLEYNVSDIETATVLIARNFMGVNETAEYLKVNEGLFTKAIELFKNSTEKVKTLKDKVLSNLDGFKKVLTDLGITRKMSADEIALILNKKIGNAELQTSESEENKETLVQRVLKLIGITGGLGGVISYIVIMIYGSTFSWEGTGTAQIITLIAIVLGFISGIVWSYSKWKAEETA